MSDRARRARKKALVMRPVPTTSNKDHRPSNQAICDSNAERAGRGLGVFFTGSFAS